jgi:hypothetical protein
VSSGSSSEQTLAAAGDLGGDASSASSGGNGNGNGKDDKLVTIVVNTTTVQLPKKTTGAAIRAAGHVPAEETLYRVDGKPGGDDPIGDGDVVHLKDGDRFESSPDGGVS